MAAANFNTPEQVVIAGHAGAVNRAMELGQSRGRKAGSSAAGERSVPLRADEARAGASENRSGRDAIPRSGLFR